ncbi:MAG: hypothetical protein OWU33_12575 [Firmicutes bacterium]|nr:hypothetical protein [Bacillota bacterium]
MTFEGYRPTARPAAVLGGGTVLTAAWLALVVAPPTSVTRALLVLWVGAAGGGLATVTRRIVWGRGTCKNQTVIWDGAPPLTGRVMKRIANPRWIGWLPRLVLPLALAGELILAAAHAALGGPHRLAVEMLVLMLAAQAWLLPIPDTILTIDTETGTRRLFVTRWERTLDDHD